MTKLNRILCLSLGFFLFTSCNRDDDNKSMPVNIEGTWRPTSITLNGTISQNGITKQFNNQTIPFGECERKTRVTFLADGTGSGISYSSNASGECVVQDQGKFTYVYNSSSNTLTTNTNNLIEETYIKDFNGSRFIGDQTLSNANFEGYTFSGKASITYEKVN